MGSPSRVVTVRVASGPDKPGRASTARWRGSGKRNGKEYARNRRLRLSSVDRLKSGG
jgi:hypothetical protein